jgi:hypothetical protein
MPYADPSDLADFLSIGDSIDDTHLVRAVDVAAREVDRFCGWGAGGFDQGDADAEARTFEATHRVHVRLRGCGFWSPAAEVVVQTDDNDDGTFETTWAANEFELVDAAPSIDGFPTVQIRATSARLFPLARRRSQRVRVTAKWGWESVPVEVEQATVLRAAQIHQRRRSADGINPITGFRAGGRDRDWELLLNDLRHPGRVFPGWG